ncbi:unnamed protein product, partial [Rotaria magnacalcarata]
QFNTQSIPSSSSSFSAAATAGRIHYSSSTLISSKTLKIDSSTLDFSVILKLGFCSS